MRRRDFCCFINLKPDAVQGNCVQLRPIAVADLDIEGERDRGSGGHEVSKTSKVLDHKSQLWDTYYARWRSIL